MATRRTDDLPHEVPPLPGVQPKAGRSDHQDRRHNDLRLLLRVPDPPEPARCPLRLPPLPPHLPELGYLAVDHRLRRLDRADVPPTRPARDHHGRTEGRLRTD